MGKFYCNRWWLAFRVFQHWYIQQHVFLLHLFGMIQLRNIQIKYSISERKKIKKPKDLVDFEILWRENIITILFSFNWSYGWSRFNTATTQLHNQPPPPYQATQSYALHATVAQTYGMHQNQCPIHRMQPCSCMHHNNTREVGWPIDYNFVSNVDDCFSIAEHVTGFRNGYVTFLSTQWTLARPNGKLQFSDHRFESSAKAIIE